MSARLTWIWGIKEKDFFSHLWIDENKKGITIVLKLDTVAKGQKQGCNTEEIQK